MPEISIPGKTTLELVEHWGSSIENDVPAFVSVDAKNIKRVLTRREVFEFSKRFAYKLNKLGIHKGDIVCNTLPNSLERIVCEFGTHFSGAATMNGQMLRSDGEDLFAALRSSKCSAVIVDPSVPKSARHLLIKEVPPGREDSVQSESFPRLKRLVICTRDDSDAKKDFLKSLSDPTLPQFRAEVAPQDLATVMTTSGSTGYSKLVKHSHANICHFGKQVKAIEPLASGAHFVNCSQLGWAGGYPQWFLSCGVTRHFIDTHDGPPADIPGILWNFIVKEKIVYGFLTPMYVHAMLTQCPWQAADWRPKLLCLAGQPVRRGLLEIIGKLCEAVDLNYGMTEANLVATHRIFDASTYVEGCAGYPGYGVNIKIVDSRGEEVPREVTGEILVQSPSLCQGYLNNEVANDAAFTQDGYFRTDDAGYLDAEGKIHVTGRQSDSILRGVYILYPAWLEQKLRACRGILDLVVVAVPDPVLYNEICACAVVDKVRGVVAGRLHVQENNSGNQVISPIASNLNKDELNRTIESIQCLTKNSSNLIDQSPHDSMKRPSEQLTTPDKTQEDTLTVGPSLLLLEKELRQLAEDVTLLHEKDALRQVPKYYVFMESFPLTSTGKVSRKEVRRLAAVSLRLTEN